jgi:outer membrane protein OmpA-like peptidoglycan-associated protein
MFRAHACALVLVACSSPVAFQGETTMVVTGTPPARDNKIALHEKIQFAYDKAEILPVSFDRLNEVATLIKKNPHIKRIRIEANHNQKLSSERARAVESYLVEKGGVGKQLFRGWQRPKM